MFSIRKQLMVGPERALSGREDPVVLSNIHTVLGTALRPPFPEGIRTVVFGSGCFWGAEEIFWQVPGIYTTAVGYVGGFTRNPSYEQVCSAKTGHTEAVLVAYDPTSVPLFKLLKLFWETHDPTQGMRQGNDVGTQYRSGIYGLRGEDLALATKTRDDYQPVLTAAGLGAITTEIADGGEFFYAEDYHQQYLDKNPHGYRCHSSTGLKLP